MNKQEIVEKLIRQIEYEINIDSERFTTDTIKKVLTAWLNRWPENPCDVEGYVSGNIDFDAGKASMYDAIIKAVDEPQSQKVEIPDKLPEFVRRKDNSDAVEWFNRDVINKLIDCLHDIYRRLEK